MHGLLRVELRTLGNLFRYKEGRGLLYAHLVTLGCIAAGALFVGRGTLASPMVVDALVGDGSGALLRALLGSIVAVSVALVASLAFAQAKRELFGEPAAGLLLSAPIRREAIVAAAALRIVLHGLPFGLALGLPLLLPLAFRVDVSRAVVVSFPLLLALPSIPAVAALLLIDVALRRFLSGFVARWVMALTLTGLGFVAFFATITGWGGGDAATRFVIDHLNGATTWLGALADPTVRSLGGMLAASVAFVLVTSRLYPIAYERTLVGDRSSGRGVSRARWPRGVLRSVFHREWLVLRQAPAHLLFFVFLFVPIAWVIRSAELPPATLLPAPIEWAWMLTMNGWWLVFLMLSALLVASMASDDARQLDLLRSVPASRRSLLLGRLGGMAMPMVWTVVSSTVSAALFTDAGAVAIALHAAVALPLVGLAIGTIAAFGTFCTYVRGADGHESPNTVYVVGGILAQMTVLLGLMFLAGPLRQVLLSYHQGTGPFAEWSPLAVGGLFFSAVWLVGFGGGWLAYRFGLRNYRRLLGPER